MAGKAPEAANLLHEAHTHRLQRTLSAPRRSVRRSEWGIQRRRRRGAASSGTRHRVLGGEARVAPTRRKPRSACCLTEKTSAPKEKFERVLAAEPIAKKLRASGAAGGQKDCPLASGTVPRPGIWSRGSTHDGQGERKRAVRKRSPSGPIRRTGGRDIGLRGNHRMVFGARGRKEKKNIREQHSTTAGEKTKIVTEEVFIVLESEQIVRG